MKLGIFLSDKLSIPIIPHFMDDWPSTQYSGGFFSPLLRGLLLNSLKGLLKRSPVRLAISDFMVKDYELCYGPPFTAFMNCVDYNLMSSTSKFTTNANKIFFYYIGGLHLNRWQSLIDIGKAIVELRKEGLDVAVKIYTPPEMVAMYSTRLTIPDAMEVSGSLAASEVPKVQRDADCLIHVESFDKNIRKYTKLSVSTKIPEYMAAARPIFGYGPEENGSLRYIKDSHCGVVVGRKNINELIDGLRLLALSSDLRTKLGLQGLKLAIINHNSNTQRKLFQEKIVEACEIFKKQQL